MIETFKMWNRKPQMNGLGFIWLNKSPRERWNFYHPTLTPVVVDEYHNHRTSFESTVIKGRLFNKRGIIVVGKQVMRTIDCITYLKKGESPDFPVIRDDIGIHEFETEIVEEGESYFMDSRDMHKAWVEEPTITKLVRKRAEETPGMAVYDINKSPLCPIANFVTPEEKCWEIIKEICQY